MMVTLGVKVGVMPSDVGSVALQKAQLRVVEDVEVSAAQAVACSPDEEVTVVFATLPPGWEEGGGAAKLEACRD